MVRNLVVWALLAVLGLATGSCAAARDGAPGYYERPTVVRAPARAGSILGSVVGVVLTGVLWGPNWLLTRFIDEPLGYTEMEWKLLPFVKLIHSVRRY